MDQDAPTDLEMELRRNLTPCRCGHVYLYHTLNPVNMAACLTCKCPEFREVY